MYMLYSRSFHYLNKHHRKRKVAIRWETHIIEHGTENENKKTLETCYGNNMQIFVLHISIYLPRNVIQILVLSHIRITKQKIVIENVRCMLILAAQGYKNTTGKWWRGAC